MRTKHQDAVDWLTVDRRKIRNIPMGPQELAERLKVKRRRKHLVAADFSGDGQRRFWEKVDKKGPSECWEWLGYKNPKGYGKCCHRYRMYSAHRIAVILSGRELPDHLSVCHHCDHPSCVNPDHLFIGTHQDNMTDMAIKERSTKGDKSYARQNPDKVPKGEEKTTAKLKNENVRFIRASNAPGIHLAQQFGVSDETIYNIKKGKTWKHLLS